MEVSAIITTYNRRDLVRRAVRSALCQTLPVTEVIVIDDGSTDGTCMALEAEFGQRICVRRQVNGGVSSARNHGLRLARGDHLALLDSDDEWMPHKNELQMQWLYRHPDIDLVSSDFVWRDEAHGELEPHRRRRDLPEDGHVLRWVLANPTLAPSTVLMRRDVYDRVGGFDESLMTAEDLDFHIRVAAHCRVGLIDEPLAWLQRGLQGLSARASSYDDALRVVEAAVARGLPIPAQDIDRALARACARAARGKVLIGQWRQAATLARRAWALEPEGPARRRLLGLLPLAARRLVTQRRHRWEL